MKKKNASPRRDKSTTRQKLIDAVGAVIRKHGFAGVGVNAVARAAGVDKVLIYRYFGSFEHLLKEFVSQRDFYAAAGKQSRAEPLSGGTDAFARLATAIVIGQSRALRSNKELQEMYRYELSRNDAVTRVIAENREREGMALMALFENHVDFSRFDLPAVSAIVTGGVIYLALRAYSTEVFNGVSLRSEEGWKRIERGVETIVASLAGALPPSPKQQRKQRKHS